MRTLALVSVGLALFACGKDPKRFSLPGDSVGGAPAVVHPRRDAAVVTCKEGARKACSYVLGTHNGVHSCVAGSSRCTDGAWGTCEEGVSVDGGSLPDGGFFTTDGDAGDSTAH